MILEVVKYGHPALRQKGARVETVTPEIKRFIADLLETMNAHHGVGLAAQQVGKALQVTVVDVREAKERPSTLEWEGKPAEPNDFMPMVLINPQTKPVADPVQGAEGCLSFPEIYGEISRPESVDVKAMNEQGRTVEFRCGGLLARAVQHELDHLNGILFIDRMDKKTKDDLRPQLEALQAATKAGLQKNGKAPKPSGF